MIVQPTPTQPPPTRRRRARWVAGFVVPPALLAVAILAGVLGPRSEVQPAPPAPTGPPAADAPTEPPPGRPDLAIPSMFAELRAVGPTAFHAAGAPGEPADALALAGFLGIDPADSACGDAPGGPYGPWCDRRGIVAQASWLGTGTGPFPPHVRVHVPVGVRLPSVIEHALPGEHLDPMPVLLVGRRAVLPAACQGWRPAQCADEFVVDRVAWAGGVRVGLTPLIDDRLQRDRRPNPFVESLDVADVPLVAALVWPEDVWRLDPDAGAIAVEGTPGEPVWYVRVLDGARTPGPDWRVRWMLLAEPDLRVLAVGRPGLPVGTAGADPPGPVAGPVPFPTVAAALEVLTVRAARARIDRGEPGPFAVKGWLGEVGPYPPCAAATGDTRGDLGPLCLRHGRLEAPDRRPERNAHLDLTIAAGTRMPPAFERHGGADLPLPVVLVGRRGPRPDPCHPTTAECNGSFIVERVTWVDGEPFDPGPVLDAWLEAGPPGWPLTHLESAKTLTIGWSGTILQAALVHRSTVARLDPEAARAMTPSPTASTIVWYVRGLETGYDPWRSHGSAPPRYSWVVVDYATGATLARGPDRGAERRSAAISP